MNALTVETLGLRERKKVRTREHIREVALRLFLEQGYEATTVQQIADTAEVSLSTLFRYFPTKARMVLPADLDTLIAEAVRAGGPKASVFDVFESAIRSSFDLILAISDAAGDDERISYTLTRAREALLGEATGTIGLVAQLIGERWGRDPHDPPVQAAAGSVVGVSLAAWTADRDLGREEALRILREGFDGLKRGFRP